MFLNIHIFSVLCVIKQTKMAVCVVIVMVISELLLYLGCLHCAGSACVFALIHSDSKVVTNISGNVLNFWANLH